MHATGGLCLAWVLTGFTLTTLHHHTLFAAACGWLFEFVYAHTLGDGFWYESTAVISLGAISGALHVHLARTRRFHPSVEAMSRYSVLKRVAWETLLLTACRHDAGAVMRDGSFPVGIINGAVRFTGCALVLFLDAPSERRMLTTWRDYRSYCRAHAWLVIDALAMYGIALCLHRWCALVIVASVLMPTVAYGAACVTMTAC